MKPNKSKGGRPRGIPKKTISFKVPADYVDAIRDEIRPHVEKSIKKHSKQIKNS